MIGGKTDYDTIHQFSRYSYAEFYLDVCLAFFVIIVKDLKKKKTVINQRVSIDQKMK
jgi:hypothetical protein